MKRTALFFALSATLLAGAAHAATPAAKPAKQVYSQAFFDALLKEQVTQGRPDTPELRSGISDELTTRQLIANEAKASGFDKKPELKTQLDVQLQLLVVRAYVTDYVQKHQPTDAEIQKEYDTMVASMAKSEYKARHILVDTEKEAQDIIAKLQKGEKFEKLAEASKDSGSKVNGGDLGWSSPQNYVKPFADAMVALQKGKYTTTPVQTQFGWHVIELDDTREAKVPSLEETKPQIQQRLQNQVVEKLIASIRSKAGLAK